MRYTLLAILVSCKVSAFFAYKRPKIFASDLLEPNRLIGRTPPIGPNFGSPPVQAMSEVLGCSTSDECCDVVFAGLFRSELHRIEALEGFIAAQTQANRLREWLIESLNAIDIHRVRVLDPITGTALPASAIFSCADLREINFFGQPEPWARNDHVAGPFWYRCPNDHKMIIYTDQSKYNVRSTAYRQAR